MTAPAIGWGAALGVYITRAGGMPRIANRLRDVWGPTADSRSTLDKLRQAEEPTALDEAGRWRAYQVLVLIGENPADWGLDRDDLGVPPGLVEYFHRQVKAPTPPRAGRRSVTMGESPAPKRPRKTTNRRNMVYSPVNSGQVAA